ncbi:MAG: peptidoglycan-binding domain-containing protein [Patescibacteria group bacterium]
MTQKLKYVLGMIAVCAFVLMPAFSGKAFALSTISASLSQGSQGSDVTTLQTFLAQDSSIYPSGLVTGYYGTLTAAAVSRFQAKYGIDVVGRVGPITRGKINELILNGGYGQDNGGTTSGASAPFIYSVGISTTTASNATTTGAITVSWSTDKLARAKLFYSNTPLIFSENTSPTSEPFISGNVLADSNLTTAKSLTISNVNANTAQFYYFMVEAVDANGNVSVTWPNSVTVR